MAIAVDATSSSGAQNNVASYSFNHTCTGTNLVLICSFGGVAGDETGFTIDSITYAGVAMTLANTQTIGAFNGLCRTYYLLNPATGTNSFSISFSKNVYAANSLISFSGANTSTIGANAGTTGLSNSASVNITAQGSNSFIVDSYLGNPNPTVDASQTQIYNVLGGGRYKASSYEQGSGTVTMSWSLASSDRWALSVVEVKAGTAAPTGVSTPTLLLMNVG